MIHPHTRVGPINPMIGVGVVATRLIPKGTVVYVSDPLDIVLGPDHPLIHHPDYAGLLETYSYRAADGSMVICWDAAKYINHSCAPSTLTTGYGFEIALRDIAPGEELTDDYAIYNCGVGGPRCACEQANCRGQLSSVDFDLLAPKWDEQIRDALRHYGQVEQPLERYLDAATLKRVTRYVRTQRTYLSIAVAKCPVSTPAA